MLYFFLLAIAFVTYELYALMILIPWNLCLLQSEKRFALSFQLYGNTGNTSIQSKYRYKKITKIKMCDFLCSFNQILRKKIDQIQLTYGSVWLWTGAELVSISISLVMNLCMCFSFVKCKGQCSKDWTCLLQIYSLLLSIP